jgi:hypothetical protein
MSRSKRRRSRSKSGSSMEAITAAIAALASKCIATIVELPIGPLILMGCPEAARCPRCTDARERRRSANVRPQPMPKADTATSPEDR